MLQNKELISDLRGVIIVLNDGREGYLSATKGVNSVELKNLFFQLAAQREVFAAELQNHIRTHVDHNEHEQGEVLGALHRTWMDIKQSLSSREDDAILSAIETGEKAAIEKFDEVLDQSDLHADHLALLQKQRTGILESLKRIETYHTHLIR